MNWTVSVAESMTGGRVSATLVEVADASTYFSGGIVSYSDQSKIELLGVSAMSIAQHGVVSEVVALQMARGVKEKFHTDIALSITGYAGPKGEDVGLMYIGIIFKEHEDCKKLRFEGKSRDEIIQAATDWMIRQIDFLRKAP